MQVFLREYGVAADIYLPIYQYTDGKRFKTDATFATGDTKIQKDGATPANITTNPAYSNSGVMVKFALSATEMQAKTIAVTLADQDGPAFLDDGFVVETFGNASALYVRFPADAQVVSDKTGYSLSAGGVTAVQSGLATTANVSAVETDTQDIQARLPASLASGRMRCDMEAVSGDATAADNLETMLDGTGGQVLSLKQLNIVNTTGTALVAQSTGGNGIGIDARGNGTGNGLNAIGGTSGNGVRVLGGATNGQGVSIDAQSVNGVALQITAQGSGVTAYPIDIVAGGSQRGVNAANGIGVIAEIAAGVIATIQSGLATTANVSAVETDTQDIQARLPASLASGRMRSDTEAISGSTITADRLESMLTGTGVADGVTITAKSVTVNNATGTAVDLQASGGGSGHGLRLRGDGLGSGFHATGGNTGHGGVIQAGGSGGTGLDILSFANNVPAMTLDASGTAAAPLAFASQDGRCFSGAAQLMREVLVEAGIDGRQALTLILAALAGKVSGAGTGTETFKGAGTETSRIVATVDASGNRTALTLTPG